jgi:hypothetical protein
MLTVTAESYPTKRPSLWKIHRGDELVAVVRPPIPKDARGVLTDLLPGDRDGGDTYRVDCRHVDDELKAAVDQIVKSEAVRYFPDPTWTWRDPSPALLR